MRRRMGGGSSEAVAARPGRRGRIAIAVALLGWGCAQVDAMRIELRQEGEHFKTFPEDVAAEYDCESRILPFFEVESDELLPERVAPGGRINHRIVYVVCPAKPTEVIAGTLETRILFRGVDVQSRTVPQALQPGRWVMDSFIPISQAAEPGVYALEVKFESPDGSFKLLHTFLISR